MPYKYRIERFHRKCPECNKKLMVEYDNSTERPYNIVFDVDAKYRRIYGILVAISCPSCGRHLKYLTTDPEFISDFDDGKCPLTNSVDEARTYLVFSKLIFGKVIPCYKALVTGKALNKNEEIVVQGGI